MLKKIGIISCLGLFSIFLALFAVALSLVPSAVFPRSEVHRLVKEYYSSDFKSIDNECLMRGKVVIVTGIIPLGKSFMSTLSKKKNVCAGSTSGIGESIALRMYEVSGCALINSLASS